MSLFYKEYLSLDKNTGAVMNFKEYVYLNYEIFPQNVDEHYFKRSKSSIEEPSCSNSVSKEEERGAKEEDSTKPYVGPSIMRLFGCF